MLYLWCFNVFHNNGLIKRLNKDNNINFPQNRSVYEKLGRSLFQSPYYRKLWMVMGGITRRSIDHYGIDGIPKIPEYTTVINHLSVDPFEWNLWNAKTRKKNPNRRLRGQVGLTLNDPDNSLEFVWIYVRVRACFARVCVRL